MDARDARLRPLLLERVLTVFRSVLSSVACRFPGSFDNALLLPLLTERRPWSLEVSLGDGAAVPKSAAESRLRPPLLLDLARVLMGLSSLELASSSGFSSISGGRFLLPLLLERSLPTRLSVLLESGIFFSVVESIIAGENESSKLSFEVSTLGTPNFGTSGASSCGGMSAEMSFDESKSSSKLLLGLFGTSEEERSSVTRAGPLTVVVLRLPRLLERLR